MSPACVSRRSPVAHEPQGVPPRAHRRSGTRGRECEWARAEHAAWSSAAHPFGSRWRRVGCRWRAVHLKPRIRVQYLGPVYNLFFYISRDPQHPRQDVFGIVMTVSLAARRTHPGCGSIAFRSNPGRIGRLPPRVLSTHSIQYPIARQKETTENKSTPPCNRTMQGAARLSELFSCASCQ